MPDEPISNPGVSPTPSTPGVPEKPQLGEEEEPGQKNFALPKEPATKGAEAPASSGKPSLMDVAKDSAQKNAQMSPEELNDQISDLKDKLSDIQKKVQDPQVTNKFSSDHHTALNKVMEKMNPDMHVIGTSTNSAFEVPQKGKKESLTDYVVRWINGSQATLSGAMKYISTDKTPDPVSFLKLQYAVQRASQRGTLFASIVGASVGGIKTILNTQL